MRFAPAVVLAALLLAPRPASAQADPALQKKIDGAIDKGVEDPASRPSRKRTSLATYCGRTKLAR